MGATTDHFDGLNKHLSEAQTSYYLKLINKHLIKSGQSAIDETRASLCQEARFDPSKGIPDLLESYRKLCLKLNQESQPQPQLIIAGNASIDDPDGTPIYNLAQKIVSTPQFKFIKNDIKLIQVPPRDQIMNAIMRISTIYLQLSHKEGFEDKITGALMKGLPTIIYRTGGMPLQIREGKSGFIAKKGDTDAVAGYLYQLLTDKKLYHRMKIAAMELINPDMNTQTNALYWLWIFDQMLNKGRKKFGFQKLESLLKPLLD
jgi:glycosyltransferase involved in cell wall biosynthesis